MSHEYIAYEYARISDRWWLPVFVDVMLTLILTTCEWVWSMWRNGGMGPRDSQEMKRPQAFAVLYTVFTICCRIVRRVMYNIVFNIYLALFDYDNMNFVLSINLLFNVGFCPKHLLVIYITLLEWRSNVLTTAIVITPNKMDDIVRAVDMKVWTALQFTECTSSPNCP